MSSSRSRHRRSRHRASLLGALLLVAVVATAAWMVWHMRGVTNASQAQQTAAQPAPPTPQAPSVPKVPVTQAKAKPTPLFDEKRTLMPPEARREFELAGDVLRRAFTSGSLAQLESCVRHPQITMPRVRALNAARRVLPVMPLEIGPKFGVTDGLLLTTLRLTDGTHRPVALEKQKNGYLLDWESLTGWCEVSFSELLARPPADTVLMRVHSSPSSAKAPFAGEKGVSLTLSHPAEKSTLSAFVPDALLKGGGAAGAVADARGTPFTLRVRADASSITQGWVRVAGVVCVGWVTDQ